MQETRLHPWFYKKCKVLIFSVYFCGARCSYIFSCIYTELFAACTENLLSQVLNVCFRGKVGWCSDRGLGGFVLALRKGLAGGWLEYRDLGQSWGFYSILCPFRSM